MRRGPWLAAALLAGSLACRTGGTRPGPADPAVEAASRLRALEEVLASRNDNDPRLDGEFDSLSPEAKKLFRRKYLALPPERRNERGTVVYLLGRNLSNDEDWAFLRQVAAEPPCLSLQDCSKPAGTDGHSASMGDEVTLAYPSLVALRQAQRAREADPRGPSPARAMKVFEAALSSKSPAAARMAQRLLGK